MAEHKHGSMNIDTQEKTFVGFVRWATWTAALAIGIIIFMGLVNG